MTADTTNMIALLPYLIQFALALACVAVIQKSKLDERFPYLREVTDSANRLASVGLSVLLACAFQFKAIISGWGSPETLLWIAKDAAVQWGMQETIYQVGLKNALKNFFSMLGIGPAIVKTSVEMHTATTADDGSVVKVDATKVVTIEPPPEPAPAKKSE